MSSSCASGSSRMMSAAELTSLPRMLPGCAARLRAGEGGPEASASWVPAGASAHAPPAMHTGAATH